MNQAGAVARDDIARAYEAAYNNADAPALARLFTEDAVLIPPNAPVRMGRGPIAAFFDEIFENMTATLSISTDELQQIGNEWAFSHGTYGVSGKGPGGEPRLIEGKWLSISRVERDGTRKIARHIWNVAPPAAEERELPPRTSA